MQASNDFIIVENKMVEEKTTDSGLLIKRAEQEAENNGVVVSVGGDVDLDLSVGDVVWFSSVECRVGLSERKLVAIREKNIVAVEKK